MPWGFTRVAGIEEGSIDRAQVRVREPQAAKRGWSCHRSHNVDRRLGLADAAVNVFFHRAPCSWTWIVGRIYWIRKNYWKNLLNKFREFFVPVIWKSKLRQQDGNRSDSLIYKWYYNFKTTCWTRNVKIKAQMNITKWSIIFPITTFT